MSRQRNLVYNVQISDASLVAHNEKLRKLNNTIQTTVLQQDKWKASIALLKIRQDALTASIIKWQSAAGDNTGKIEKARAQIAKLTVQIQEFERSLHTAPAKLGAVQRKIRDVGKAAEESGHALSGAEKAGYSKFISTVTKLYIAIHAVKAAFNLLMKGAQSIDLEVVLGRQIKNYTAIVREAEVATAGLISRFDIKKSMALMSSFGIPVADLGKTLESITKMAIRTGQDTTYMMNSLALGVSRLSPKILDNLGIQVSLKDAYAQYAAEIGKTTSALTALEQKQALVNEVLRQTKDLTQDIDLEGAMAAPLQKAKARLDNFITDVGETAAIGVNAVFETVQDFKRFLLGTLELSNEDNELLKIKLRLTQQIIDAKKEGVKLEPAVADSIRRKLAEIEIDRERLAIATRLKMESARAPLIGPGSVWSAADDLFAQRTAYIQAVVDRSFANMKVEVAAFEDAYKDILTTKEKTAVVEEFQKRTYHEIASYVEGIKNETNETAIAAFTWVFSNRTNLGLITEIAEKVKARSDEKKEDLLTSEAIQRYLLKELESQERLFELANNKTEAQIEQQRHQETYNKKVKELRDLIEKAQKNEVGFDENKAFMLQDQINKAAELLTAANERLRIEKIMAEITDGARLEYLAMNKEQLKAEKKRLEAILERIKAEALYIEMARIYGGLAGVLFTHAVTTAFEDAQKRLKELEARIKGLGGGGGGGRAKETPEERGMRLSVSDDFLSADIKYELDRRLAIQKRLVLSFPKYRLGLLGDDDVLQLRMTADIEAMEKLLKPLFEKVGKDWKYLGELNAMEYGDSFSNYFTANREKIIKAFDRLIEEAKKADVDIEKLFPGLLEKGEAFKNMANNVDLAAASLSNMSSAMGAFSSAANEMRQNGDDWVEGFGAIGAGLELMADGVIKGQNAYEKLASAQPLISAFSRFVIQDLKAQAAINMLFQAALAFAAFANPATYAAGAMHVASATLFGAIAGGAIKLPSEKPKKAKKEKEDGDVGTTTGGPLHIHIYGPILQSEADRGVLIRQALEAAGRERR